ncbi:MAG: hypothetical protein COS15_04060 [Caldiserica bacterium CG02_land_8_20_14_3_00_36_38]|nr:DUF401 family protein [Caldisericota bacterium]PIP49519.1 MAG: hypothetical protein COX13_03525 [Caldiserica bacterium CG23_combo_of_CG06-09_8_20_14_all_35_60]PIV55206.1 MAG: hypothetical protein COS15_04060 [Caldiserica bacterium CG02_land_8_20_14_3_00_36_38]PIX28906.1 MAG: hypothetical protein COZ65_03575 [Caldiserica bacterium CG_4_8_14_3_um_filter_35_18]
MIDLIILLSAILLLGVLIILKLNLGFSIFISAIFLGILRGFNFLDLLKNLWITLSASDTLEVLIIVVFITIFVSILATFGFLEEIVKSFSKIFSPKIFIPAFAFIVGALPMPGGALVSAPLVEEGAKSSVISSGEKTVINYWFRHIWEPVSPIYPEMPMNAAILGASIPFIVSVQWPVSVAMIVSGIIFLLPLIRVNGDSKLEKSFKFYLEALQSVLPLVLVILLILVLKLSIILSIAAGILYVIFVKRVSFQKAIKSIDLKFLFKILFLMFSIFYLKYTVIDSNVITGVYKVLEIYNVPNFIILFFLPFIVGIMTGASTATFGVSYPLLLPIIRSVNIIPLNLFIAFVGGWLGIMLTPTHLCLSLSIEYFSAKFKETYIILIKNLAFVFLLSVLWMLVLKFSR